MWISLPLRATDPSRRRYTLLRTDKHESEKGCHSFWWTALGLITSQSSAPRGHSIEAVQLANQLLFMISQGSLRRLLHRSSAILGPTTPGILKYFSNGLWGPPRASRGRRSNRPPKCIPNHSQTAFGTRRAAKSLQGALRMLPDTHVRSPRPSF